MGQHLEVKAFPSMLAGPPRVPATHRCSPVQISSPPASRRETSHALRIAQQGGNSRNRQSAKHLRRADWHSLAGYGHIVMISAGAPGRVTGSRAEKSLRWRAAKAGESGLEVVP
jgi:hypothetical protein